MAADRPIEPETAPESPTSAKPASDADPWEEPRRITSDAWSFPPLPLTAEDPSRSREEDRRQSHAFGSSARTTAFLLGTLDPAGALVSLLDGFEVELMAPTPEQPRPPRRPDLLIVDETAPPIRAGVHGLTSACLQQCPILLLRAEKNALAPAPTWADLVEAYPLDPGRLRRALSVLADLSRARRASELSFRAMEASVNGVSIADATRPGFPLVYVSPTFERITGYTAAEVLGKNCRFLQGESTSTEAVERVRTALREGTEARVVLDNVRKDGSPFVNELTLLPIRDQNGATVFVVGVQHDITENIAAKSALEHSRLMAERRHLFIESILEGIHSAIVTADAEERVTFINRAARALLGKTTEDCLGASVHDVLQLPNDVRTVFDDAHESHRITYRLRRADGNELLVGMSVSRAEDGDGNAHAGTRYIIFRDLGEVQHAEMERSRVQRLAALGTMVSGFAHEVRNPVAGVRLLVEAMQVDTAPGDPHAEDLQRIVRQLDRIERLVRTALQFGRPEPPSRSSHAPEQLAFAALEALAPRLEGKPIACDTAADLPRVYVDDGHLVQVLVILLTNALDACGSAEGVRLVVSWDADNTGAKRVKFDVIDNGRGIPAALIDRIFDPFFTTKATGTGLGLSIAQQLVTENGGKLLIASSAGHTTFSVLIPAVA